MYFIRAEKSRKYGDFYPFYVLDKDIKVRTEVMATKRKTTRLRGGDVYAVEEYHDGRYGAPGMPRQKKKKPTKEDMQKVNDMNKARLCQYRLIQYFTSGDYFATLTYKASERPPDMETAKQHFRKLIRYIRKECKKRGSPLFWIRNIERGTKGAWHIHLVINRIPDTARILEDAWNYGGIYLTQLKKSKYHSEDFAELAAYITKGTHTREKKTDGSEAAPRIKEASYSTSRNMPLPEPRKKKLARWPKEVKPKKGYYIARIHEGINPKTGYKYRRYTLIRLNRRI